MTQEHKHHFKHSGYCEWTSKNGEIKKYEVKKCLECGELLEKRIDKNGS